MLNALTDFLHKHLNPAEDDSLDQDQHEKMVTSALLIEMINADHQQDSSEQEKVIQLLTRTFSLNKQEAEELMQLAGEKVENATSLYEFTGVINSQFDDARKLHIIELLWEVAYADGQLDKYEDYLVRKVADLIHVSHSDFIRMKHRVQQRLGQT